MAQMKIVGKGKLRVNLRRNGKSYPGLRRMVKTIDTLSNEEFAIEAGMDSETVLYIVREISRIVRAGYEVRLGEDNENGIRFYPLMNAACNGMVLIAQTIGDYRDSLHGAKYEIYQGGNEIDSDEAKERVAENRVRVGAFKSVTPDTMVECPKCGAKFRVGQRLARKE